MEVAGAPGEGFAVFELRISWDDSCMRLGFLNASLLFRRPWSAWTTPSGCGTAIICQLGFKHKRML